MSSLSERFYRGVVDRPIAVTVMIATLIVIGVLAYAKIPLQMMPDGFTEPGLEVFVSHPGSSAQENEERVARPLEEQLRTLNGISEIFSNSREDFVGISIEFNARTDMNLAKAEVRDRVERARPQLPSTVEQVGIWSFSNDQLPVMFFTVMHPGDSPETDFLIDEVVKRRLEAVDGVSRVEIWGVLDDSMRILLDEDKVRAHGLDLGALIRRMSEDNFALPMGEVTDGAQRLVLRSDMRFKDAEEIARYPVVGGLKIGDLGRVEKVKSVRDRLFKIDGSYAYFGEVQKDNEANVVATSARLRAALKELEQEPRLAGRFAFLPLFDQGRFIEASLSALEETALVGGLLSIVVLYLFLWRARLTLVVAFSIPLSILFAIAWIFFSGGSFNILTMTGITLATGMLVDNAVVVVENISRLRQEGADARSAASVGAHQVSLAVTLSTLTTVVVFAPLIFMTENPVTRIIFGELGVPLCISLLFSLVAALVVQPTVAAYLVGKRPRVVLAAGRRLAPLGKAFARAVAQLLALLRYAGDALGALVARAARLCFRALSWAWAPLGLGGLCLCGWRLSQLPAEARFAARLGNAGLAATSSTQLALSIVLPALVALYVLAVFWRRWRRRAALPLARPAWRAPRGDSLVELIINANSALMRWSMRHRKRAVLACLAILFSTQFPFQNMKITAFGQDEDTGRVDVQVRLESNFTLGEAEQEMNYYERYFAEHRERYGYDHIGVRFDERGGRASMYWDEAQTRESHERVRKHLRENLKPPPGHQLFYYDAESQAAAQNSKVLVAFDLSGPDSDELEAWAKIAQAELAKIEGLSGVTSPLESAPSQVRVRFDSDLAQGFGISPSDAFQSISWALRGWSLPRFHEPGRELPLIIEYDDERVAGLDTLRDLEIYGAQSPVPLSAMADLSFAQGPKSISRRNGQTTITLTAKVDDPTRQRQLSDAGYAALRQLDLPQGVSVGGLDSVGRRQDDEFKEIRSAFLLSLVLVFLLMGILFESFVLPWSVLFTVPFAVCGAIWTLYVTGTNMDSVGWIGMIILAGVVVNNGIVLVDRIHGMRREGVERERAVIEGTAQRVRAVLMTALTTILGLVPMALSEPSADAIDYRALATCVAGGLLTSTVFTLWVVPLAYTLIEDATLALQRMLRWSLRPRSMSRGAGGRTKELALPPS